MSLEKRVAGETCLWRNVSLVKRIARETCLESLINYSHYRIPEVIVNVISVLYNKSKSAVMVDGNISGPFQVTTGVLQGNENR